MNDKIQLAAMGEHMAEQAAQPMCMAKRIEELEAQVRVMAELLRDLREGAEIHLHNCTVCKNADGITNWTSKLERIDAALAGKLPDHTEQPLAMVPGGWIPVTERTPADERDVWCFGSSEGDDEWHGFVGHRNTRKGEWWEHNNGDYIDGGYGDNYPARVTHWMPLPASPSPDATK